MKRSFISILFAGFVLSSTAWATVWDISLDLDQNPWSDTPAWGGIENMGGYYGTRIWGDGPPINADGYYREIDTTSAAGNSMYYQLGDGSFDPDFDSGFTMETRLRIHNGSSQGGQSVIARSDGDSGASTDGYIAYQPYYYWSGSWFIGLRVDNGGGAYTFIDLTTSHSVPVQDGPNWLPTPWLDVRTVAFNGQADIYIDDVLRHTVDLTAGTNTSTTELVQFGDLSGGASGFIDYDYVRIAYVPEPSTWALLLFACAGLHVLRRR